MSKSSIKAIFHFLASDKYNLFFFALQFILSSICSVLGSLEFLAIAVFIPNAPAPSSQFKQALYVLHELANTYSIYWSISLLVVLFLIRSILNYTTSLSQEYWNSRTENLQRRRLLENLIHRAIGELEHQEPGNLSKQIDLESQLLAKVPSLVLKYWIQLPILFCQTFIVCCLISWKIIFILGPCFGLTYLLRNQLVKKSQNFIKHTDTEQASENAKLISLFQGFSILKLFGAESSFLQSYFQLRDQIRKKQFSIVKQRIFFKESVGFLMTGSSMALCAYTFFVLKSNIQDILLIVGTAKQLHDPMKNYSHQLGELDRAVPIISKLQTPITNKRVYQAARLPHIQIELDSLSFSYGGQWRLKPLSLQIRAGEKIALIGSNGAGKSTLLKLLAGFYHHYDGHIYFDGIQSISDISYTIQRPFLFSGTVRENIAFYQNMSQQQIEEAAWQSCASEFINQMPQQYDSYLTNDGSALSGGQRQKIHLARSFARKSPILLLDEATASLDLDSEQNILANCRKQTWQTQIVVSHRREIIDWADRVIEI